ncbi:PREDICTED: putative WEB family protein At1g65010, chloroplastic [Tarenaya hassleriana]|uniref:putative WEB family protein At1g65010, chloroplastic n=1 Tax=Tarenaya hassleriana TaxID=28532 RepID=UPI00053C7AAB|nr:PREDICTED: putative WEB family protein At1g65010, chloroplastic [Tarenaya hassleriana]
MNNDTRHSSGLKTVSQTLSSPKHSSKVADIGTELSRMRASLDTKETETKSLIDDLSEKNVRLRELEAELDKRRLSERKLLDSLHATKILVDESKTEIASLKERLDGSDHSQESSEDDSSVQENEAESLRTELEASSLKLSGLVQEMGSVKNELKLATEAEVTSKKAMDDLAMALTEVATDCNQAKEKLAIAEMQLEAERLESNKWKAKLEATEENYYTLLQEARKEAEVHKNTTERLRIEAEESLLAWNGTEAVFVSCIKKGEDEKNSLIDENNRLIQALMNAENLSRKAKDENHKLRDILKQAINEANVAKEAAGIARAENSQLKDALMEKDEELQFSLQEVERLKLREAMTNENVKNLTRLLSEAELAKELMAEEKDRYKVMSRQNSSGKENSPKNPMQKDQELEKRMEEREKLNEKREDKKENHKDKKEHHKDKKENHKEKKEDKRMGKTCSFSLRDLKLTHSHNSHKHKDTTEEEATKTATNNNNNNRQDQDGMEEVEMESEANSPDGSDPDLFKGSIFDVAETPNAETTHHHRRRSSSTFLEDGMNSDDLENLEGTHFEEGENEKGGRKKKAFIRRFGDLLVRRKSFQQKKETSSSDQQEKQQLQQPPLTPPPTPPQLPSPEH